MSGQPPASSAEALMADQLRKVLELEKRMGYSDKAVIGGLDRFVHRWALDAHRTVQHPMFRSSLRRLELLAPDYARKTEAQRAAWIDRVLHWANGFWPAVAAQPPQRKQTPLLRPGQDAGTRLADVRGFTPFWLTKLEKLGVATVRDLLYFFPRRHIDFSSPVPIAQLQVGREQCAIGDVWTAREIKVGRGGRIRAAEADIGDESGTVRIVWFNQPYISKGLRPGVRIAVGGRVGVFQGRKVFENPDYEVAGDRELLHTGRLVPVYQLTEGLTARRMRQLMKQMVDEGATLLADFLPAEIKARQGLLPLPEAARQAHFPASEQAKEEARWRLAFDELFLIQLGVLGNRRQWTEGMPGHPLKADPAILDAFVASLPFQLTGAQRRCIQEIMGDLGRSIPMGRLLQGEVGSGKTVVALAAVLVAVANGQQVGFMAPTGILAEQHFRTIRGLLEAAPRLEQADETITVTVPGLAKPVVIALLTGSLSRKRKQEVQALTARGEIDVLVGTHALFQREVEFASLGLVIVDEQHRFGVMQRKELRQKGYNPHLLVMTATPIPRTLSLTLYGDLDISVIDELPPGRRQVRTKRLDASRRESAYAFVRKQVAESRQAFIVYPLIEESARLEAAAARQEHERLGRDVFPDLRLGLLHGRLKAAEKDKVMRQFRDRELDILVTTAVVEVGIDVPNATVMLVESADRFGLAQLHQFRGRVGRGDHDSYCVLVSETPSAEASERLRLMEEIHDGFRLAEEDLRLRGPGEFFGTRQSGMPDLRMARLSDVPLLEAARAEAAGVFERDPRFELPQHRALAEAVERAWQHRTPAPGEA